MPRRSSLPSRGVVVVLGVTVAVVASVARAQERRGDEGDQDETAPAVDAPGPRAEGAAPDPVAPEADVGATEDEAAAGGVEDAVPTSAAAPVIDVRDHGVEDALPTSAAAPSEQPDPITFEPGGGVTIRSDDRDFALTIGARGQFRAQLDVPSGAAASFGFTIRRARVDLSGHVFGEHNRFEIELAFSPDDLGWNDATGPRWTPLLDFVVVLDHLRDLTLVIGQRKMPFARERMVSSRDLAMVDRSITDGALSLDRDFGVWLSSDDLFGAGFFRYWAGVSGGEGRDGLVGDDADLAYSARIELLPLGLFDSYEQGALDRPAAPRLAIGLAYVFLDDSPWIDGLGGTRPDDGGTTDTHQAALDATFVADGFAAMLGGLLRYGRRRPGTEGPVTPASNGAGGFLQLGCLVPDTFVELTARYAMMLGFGDTSFQDRGELGGAVSLYFEGHPLKLQLEYFHLWSDFDAFDRGEERVRLQLQLTL